MTELIPGTVFPTWRSLFARTDPRSTISREDIFDVLPLEVIRLFKESQPSAFTMSNRRLILERLEGCLQRKYGSRYVVSLFGSSAYFLDSPRADMDICLVDTENNLGGPPPGSTTETPYNLFALAGVLREGGFVVNVVVTNANTPIIRAVYPSYQMPIPIDIDINVNNLSGNYNTLLISSYARLSPTLFLPLANFLKLWAQAHGLSSSHTSPLPPTESITSYSLTLLLLTFLVKNKTLEDLFLSVRREWPGWVDEELRVKPRTGSVQHHRQMFFTGPLEVASTPPSYMRKLLLEFFSFVVKWNGKTKDCMMSLRLGGLAKRTSKETALQIEDPLLPDRNTTANVSSQTAALLFHEARYAKKVVQSGGNVEDLFVLIKKPERRAPRA